MKILVTGSTGFIGSKLCCALLAAGHAVRAFHRPNSSLTALDGLDVEHAIGDLSQPETLDAAMAGIQAVFHVAALMNGRQAGKQYAVTVEGTRAVVKAALSAKVQRFVHTSSVAALGVPAFRQISLLNEDHTWNFPPERYPYGYAKYLAELEIQKAVAQGLNAVIVNPALVFGPGDQYRLSSSPLVAVARRKLNISAEGGINVVHIEDVVAGHLAALERGRRGQRYILGGENLTLLAMLQTAARVAQVPPPRLVVPAALLRAVAGPASLLGNFLNLPVSPDLLFLAGFYFYYDTRKAAAELGLPAPRPAEDAIRGALDWFSHKQEPLPISPIGG